LVSWLYFSKAVFKRKNKNMHYIPEPKPMPVLIAKFMSNDLAGILKNNGFSTDYRDCPIDPQDLRMMLELMNDGHLDRKDVRLWCVETCKTAKALKEDLGYVYDFLNSAHLSQEVNHVI
jgi:Asp-tRNA(Asn)/Glu-tRNA(Gln) amidotransferase B subunit